MKAISATLLASIVGCAFVQPALAADGGKAKESVLYSFGSGTDGQYPGAGLIDVKGTLYGTTERGGTSGNGAVFAVNQKTGKESVLYSFCSQANCADGQYAGGSLLDVNGTLYGMTEAGGASGYGTVFSLNPGTGAETVIYSFTGGDTGDGAYPAGNLIDVNGTLYGTTPNGGTHVKDATGYGIVFAIDSTTGKETILHSFCSNQNCGDGGTPAAGLIDVNGKLYGTTSNGGVNPYAGTVFAYDLKLKSYSVVYSFCSQSNCTDGDESNAGLIDVNGVLYGTTSMGGTNNMGTVFSVDAKAGTEKVLYSFCSRSNCADGANPYASLIDVKGTLYGTTFTSGGVFAVNATTGKEKVVYTFCSQQGCTDGEDPYGNLIDAKGSLYSTTQKGGSSGFGTVFALKP